MTGFQRTYRLAGAEATRDFAASIAPRLRRGDVILLHGGLGAGKTHFARSLIQTRMSETGFVEDVPSPTFTLVQTYDVGSVDIWHADLYRLSSVDEVYELGLDEAMEQAICLIEWPDRLGSEMPADALTLRFEMTEVPGERLVTASADTLRWADVLDG